MRRFISISLSLSLSLSIYIYIGTTPYEAEITSSNPPASEN
jgi:hypothetical protein